ncbi:MAG: carboxypeptidase-like regulatory domain-containing protein [Bacteroidetes bacterium]|nr:carboxypeptidase-like regulatory domain-containing protein [Bacteroidota bacterium]
MKLQVLALLLLPLSVWADITVSGKVTDAKTGEGLIGATVRVMGTTIGAFTDVEGNFTINNVPYGSNKLVVSYTGYKNFEYDLENGTSNIEIALKQAALGKNRFWFGGYLAYNQSLNSELGYGLKGGVSKVFYTGYRVHQINLLGQFHSFPSANWYGPTLQYNYFISRFVPTVGAGLLFNNVNENSYLHLSPELGLRFKTPLIRRITVFSVGYMYFPKDKNLNNLTFSLMFKI